MTAFRDELVLGHGPGTFERLWLERRPVEREAREAHSLYLETLAEQGIVGGLLLAAVLAVPLVAVVRHGRATAAAAAGAYVTYLVHAGLDWDWEMPAVTAAGLLAGVAILKLGRAETRQELAVGERLLVATTFAVVLTGSVFALAGNWRVTQARDALTEGRPASALAAATRASPSTLVVGTTDPRRAGPTPLG